jgi:hypothetical protein
MDKSLLTGVRCSVEVVDIIGSKSREWQIEEGY